jgi:hypothetical protein
MSNARAPDTKDEDRLEARPVIKVPPSPKGRSINS